MRSFYEELMAQELAYFVNETEKTVERRKGR